MGPSSGARLTHFYSRVATAVKEAICDCGQPTEEFGGTQSIAVGASAVSGLHHAALVDAGGNSAPNNC
jgi:hypothetical protein